MESSARAQESEFAVPAWVPHRIAVQFERPLIRKLWKYSMTSVFGVVMGQSLIFLFASGLGWSPLLANFAAVCITTVPSFFISKHWVWKKSGRANLYGEVIPFWLLNLLGFAMSHVTITVLEHRWPDQPLVANIGNGIGYGMVWVLKFVVLDRVLFKVTHEQPAEGPPPLL